VLFKGEKGQLDGQLRDQLEDQLWGQLDGQLRDQLWGQLDGQLRDQLDNQLRDQLEDQLWDQLEDQLDGQLDGQLWGQLDGQLDGQLWGQLNGQLRGQLKDINNNWSLYQWLNTYAGWYDYGKMIGVKFDKEKYELFMMFNEEVHFIIPYEGVCFISEKPVEIHWKNKELHRDGDMAVKYKDGYGMYCLNGIRVPEYLAITPESKLDIEFFTKEKNADVKAEFIRKYGIDRMVSLGKKIDSWKNYKSNHWWAKSEYELFDMSPIFTSVRFAPHILMRNQTTKTYHLEGVAPECKTLEQAIEWRENIKHEKYKTIAIK
jgi:hypothetical protein